MKVSPKRTVAYNMASMITKPRFCLKLSTIAVLAMMMFGVQAQGEVAVFSNRTSQPLTISLLADGRPPTAMTIERGESRPVFYRSSLRVGTDPGTVGQQQPVQPKSAYFFTRGPQGDEPLRMEQIGFGNNRPAASPPAPLRVGQDQLTTTIPVKILVDDDEPTHRHIWEAKLRNRIAKASAILQRHCGVVLHVVEVATWDSDDRQHDFEQSLREFEREVVPDPARIAIGFSSQYKVAKGRHHAGGTRGALYPYILLKERSPHSVERERLELLLHELGHHLAASHSPEPQSVMRPLLTSAVQRQAGSQVQFDPVNTLLMSMVSDEIRQRGITRLAQVSGPTKTRMQEIYSVLAQAMPNDPAASQYLKTLGAAPITVATRRPGQVGNRALLRNSARVLSNLVTAVEARRPKASNGEQIAWYEGDQLTEFYVRRAALAALQSDPEDADRVFLTVLGIFMDRSGALRKSPVSSAVVSQIESELVLKRRMDILGKPTLMEREDLAAHFFLSAMLTASLGEEAAFKLGLSKEVADSNGGSGFSFADLAADRAGIEFALRVMESKTSLEDLSEQFSVSDYMPPVDGLEEGLSAEQIRARFGDLNSKTFKEKVAEIDRLVRALPAYSSSQED